MELRPGVIRFDAVQPLRIEKPLTLEEEREFIAGLTTTSPGLNALITKAIDQLAFDRPFDVLAFLRNKGE